MQRSLGIFLCGLILGGLAGYALHRPREQGTAGPTAGIAQGHSSVDATERPGAKRKAEDEKILLGDIASVPFQELYETLARQRPEDIARIAQQLDSLPPGRGESAKIKAFFTAWAHLDPNAAFAAAVGFQGKEARQSAISATIAGADASATGTIAMAIDNMSKDVLADAVRSNLLSEAIAKWSEVDPAAAAQALSSSSVPGMGFTPAVYGVGINWGASDPAAALAWAEKQPHGFFAINPINGVVLGWWKKDPAAAEAYVVAKAGTPDTDQLIPTLISEMASEDKNKAVEFLSHLPDGKLRQQGYGMLASQLSFTDPKAASVWALSLPADVAPDAVGSSISVWARSDPAAAGQWIEGLSGKVRDSAISSYSYALVDTDPAAAANRAITISDVEQRKKVLRRAFAPWLKRDPAAARAWISSSSLGEEEIARLLATPAPSP